MHCLRLAGRLAAGLVVALCALVFVPAVKAQGQGGNAGVEISPEGVLRTRMVRDPSGALYRERVAAARATLDPRVVRPSKLRKISLNRLEAAAASRLARGEALTDEMKYLAGLIRLKYVFFFPETGDIVIAGPAEGFVPNPAGRMVGITSGRSVLELQDLVVALRAFPPSGERTICVGVSIDPTPEGLARMRQYIASLRGRITPRDAQRIAAGMRASLGLNIVTVKGISPKTHFAQVLVEADYRMKLIGIGLERPPVRITSFVDRARPGGGAQNALYRWYLTPNYECVRVSADDLAMELVGEGVKLVGQDELVTAGGDRVATKHTSRASQAYCHEFTEKYPQLAQKVPVYAQLRNLIDMLIAAAFIQQQDYYSQAGWAVELFGNETRFPVATNEAPRFVESMVNVVWKGRTLMTPIGGGVHIEPLQALAPDRLLRDEQNALPQLRGQTAIKSLPPGQWWWD